MMNVGVSNACIDRMDGVLVWLHLILPSIASLSRATRNNCHFNLRAVSYVVVFSTAHRFTIIILRRIIIACCSVHINQVEQEGLTGMDWTGLQDHSHRGKRGRVGG